MSSTITKYWRNITFSFTGKGTYAGTFAIEVDNSGVPITDEKGNYKFESISGDAVDFCSMKGNQLEISNKTLPSAALLSNFASAVENQTYTESGDIPGTWSYVNASSSTEWRQITFSFDSEKTTISGTFVIEVSAFTGVPTYSGGNYNFASISGDEVTAVYYDDSKDLLQFYTNNGGGVCTSFSTAVASQTYTEQEPAGTWSYVIGTAPTLYSITSTAGVGGTISPSGTTTVYEGGSQAYSIAPSTGFDINDVLVDSTSVGTVSTYTFSNVQADHTISASFNPVQVIKTYRVITFSFTGKGAYSGVFQIAVDSNGIPDTTDFESISGDSVTDVYYKTNEVLYLEGGVEGQSGALSNFSTAVPNQTYTEQDYNGTWSYTLGSTITAYTIVPSAGANGAISPNDPVIVNEGSSQAFTITPSAGYKIASVLVDGTEAKQDLVNNVYTFTNVSAVHTIAASFEELGTAVIEVSTNLTGIEAQKFWEEFMAKIVAWGYYISNTFNSETGTGTITIIETDTLPDGIFQGKTQITSVVLPDCFTEIEDAAFAGCSNLVSITLPDNIEVIGADAFSECTSLTSLELPASVTEVGEGFLDACESLETLTCNSPVPPTTGSTISTLTLPTLIVPKNALPAYQNNPVWGSSFVQIIPKKSGDGYGFNTSGMIDTDYMEQVRFNK